LENDLRARLCQALGDGKTDTPGEAVTSARLSLNWMFIPSPFMRDRADVMGTLSTTFSKAN
jgi:hypothetical protein